MAGAPTRPTSGRRPRAYLRVADRLREEIAGDRYADGEPLPTEAELGEQHAVSRQTVRRAFQDLVAEGLVRRIPGKGTFVNDRNGKYLRSSGSIEELMALSVDSELEVVTPPTIGVDIEAAGRLHLDTDEIVRITFRRVHDGRPYCVTTAYLPVPVGSGLISIADLHDVGARRRTTVLSIVQRLAGRPIAGADQTITAVVASAEVAAALECSAGDPVLRIDRLYFDDAGELLELAINHFNPERYTYRFQMRATH
jgi:DNA-binding GntR family transcriptional regulator